MASIADEIEYKLDAVKVTSVPSDQIDKTFRSTSIGKLINPVCHNGQAGNLSNTPI